MTEQEMIREIIDVGYKTLAKRYHPDCGGNIEDFKVLGAAVEELRSLVMVSPKSQSVPAYNTMRTRAHASPDFTGFQSYWSAQQEMMDELRRRQEEDLRRRCAGTRWPWEKI